MKEITIQELNNFPKEVIQLVDIRNEDSIIYGMMPGAINITYSDFSNDTEKCITKLQKDKKIVIYCQRGEMSKEVSEQKEISLKV